MTNNPLAGNGTLIKPIESLVRQSTPKLEQIIDIDVIQLVKKEFSQHISAISTPFNGQPRQNALLALDHFISNNLPHFGDYQDAMVYGSDFMFHVCSRLFIVDCYCQKCVTLPKQLITTDRFP